MDKEIVKLIRLAKMVFISEESSREDLIEIIQSQLDFWDELEEYLNSKNKPKRRGITRIEKKE